jgi:hypothetical protein
MGCCARLPRREKKSSPKSMKSQTPRSENWSLSKPSGTFNYVLFVAVDPG